MRIWRNMTSRLFRISFAGLLVALMVFTFLIPWSTIQAEGGVDDLSLYQRTSELTREFASALSPGSGTERLWMLEVTNESSDDLLVAGNAGGLLGYADILADDTGIVGWLMNSWTASSATITYDQLENMIDVPNADNPFLQYAGYGEVLTEMGLAKTIREGSLANTGRIVATGLVIIIYLLANTAPFLFRGALMILEALNPFKLFTTVIDGVSSANLGVLSGVAEYVGDIYKTIQDFSVVFLLPMLLVMTILGVLLFNKTSAMKRFGRYFIRVFMIFAGLPLIGATYTGVVEDLQSQVEIGSEYADYLVLSTYVDFENWAKYSRLAPPADTVIKNPRYESDDERSVPNRALVLEVNGTRAGNYTAYNLRNRYSSTSDIGAIFSEGGDTVNVDDTTFDNRESGFNRTFNLLRRHMTTSTYTSSDYNGEVSGQIQRIRQRSGFDEDVEKAIVQMFTISASGSRTWKQTWNPLDWGEDWEKAISWNGSGKEDAGTSDKGAKGLFTRGYALNDVFKFGDFNFHIYNTGDLRYDNGYTTPHVPRFTSEFSKIDPIGIGPGGSDPPVSPNRVMGGLSPLSMYNFLNTTFSDSGLTIYSSDRTASDLSRDVYASVTFAGSGVSSFTKWVENLTVMLSLAVLSIAFGLMMLSVAIQNIPRILSGVFGTALGSIQYITKLLIATVVMIVQILGMIFFYLLSENIIMTMLLNFNELVDNGGTFFNSGVLFDFLGSFLVIAIVSAVTFFMIRFVKTFKEMMEEVVSNAINRVMGLLDTSTGGQGIDQSKTTGGRMKDGKLTDSARESDGSGLTGALQNAAAGGLIGGAAGLLADAHDIEAKREGMMDSMNQKPRSAKEKLQARMGTFSDLAKAKGRDIGKSAVGMEGRSLAREKDLKDSELMAMRYTNAPLGEAGRDELGVNKDGQAVDENGEVITDENGNAVDADGNAISSATKVGLAGDNLMVDKDTGVALDADGNAYADEAGNPFYVNDKGELVDANGDYVALNEAGILEASDEPVNAKDQAEMLDGMRFDADAYQEMQEQQKSSHYGLDNDGNVIGEDGEPLQVVGDDGSLQPAQLDDDGFVVDEDGNRVSASDIDGQVDARGFETVTDPETGEQHLQHKGDEAMRNGVNEEKGSDDDSKQSLSGLALQATKADAIAQRAQQRVSELKKNGASPYAISQAERYADKANQKAQVAQRKFGNEMKRRSDPNNPNKSKLPESVTKDHVQSASRYAQSQQQALNNNVAKLQEMKKNNAPANEIAKQQRRVDEQRERAQEASNMSSAMKVASQTGRSYGEVAQAQSQVARAEQVFAKRQDAYDKAVAGGNPKQIAKSKQSLDKASNVLAKAHSNMDTMKQKPQGTLAQRDMANAKAHQAKTQYSQANARLNQLMQNGVPEKELHDVRATKTHARQQLDKATEASMVFNRAQQGHKKATNDVASAERELNSLRQSGAPRQQVQQVESRLSEAKSRQGYFSKTMEKQRLVNPNYAKAKQSFNQASAQEKSLQRDLSSLQATNAPREQIERTSKQLNQTVARKNEAQKAMKQHGNPQQMVSKAQARYNEASTRESVLSQKQVIPQGKYETVKKQQAQAKQRYVQAQKVKQRMSAPVDNSPKKAVPKVVPTTNVSPSDSFVALTSKGVTNYDDYRHKVQGQQNALRESQAKLRQEQQRLVSYKRSSRPPQDIQKVEQEVQRLNASVHRANSSLNELQQHAQGLLKNGNFQPKVASRPIRHNGTVLINQMVEMNHTQGLYERLQQQQKTGVITDAGRQQLNTLQKRLSGMRSNLVKAGIREDMLKDRTSIAQSAKQMRAEWSRFVKGNYD